MTGVTSARISPGSSEPVRAKKVRQNKKPEPSSNSMRTEKGSRVTHPKLATSAAPTGATSDTKRTLEN